MTSDEMSVWCWLTETPLAPSLPETGMLPVDEALLPPYGMPPVPAVPRGMLSPVRTLVDMVVMSPVAVASADMVSTAVVAMVSVAAGVDNSLAEEKKGKEEEEEFVKGVRVSAGVLCAASVARVAAAESTAGADSTAVGRTDAWVSGPLPVSALSPGIPMVSMARAVLARTTIANFLKAIFVGVVVEGVNKVGTGVGSRGRQKGYKRRDGLEQK